MSYKNALLHMAEMFYPQNVRFNDTGTFRISDQIFYEDKTIGTWIYHFLTSAQKAWALGDKLYHWSGWKIIPSHMRELDKVCFTQDIGFYRLDYTYNQEGVPQIFEIDANPWGREFVLGLEKSLGFEETIATRWPNQQPLVIQKMTTCWNSLAFFLKEVGGTQMMGEDFIQEYSEFCPDQVERYFRFNFKQMTSAEYTLYQWLLQGKITVYPNSSSLLSKLLFAALWDEDLKDEWLAVGTDLDQLRTIIPKTYVLHSIIDHVRSHRKQWVIKDLDYEREAGSKGVFVGKRQSQSGWNTILETCTRYSIASQYTSHDQFQIRSIDEQRMITDELLDIVYRPFYWADQFLGGAYVAGVSGKRGGKLHGGADVTFGVMR